MRVDEEGGQQGSLVIIRGLSQDQVSVRVEGAPKNFNQARHGGDTAYRFNESAAFNATYTRRDTAQYYDGAGQPSLGGATGSDDHNVLLKGAFTPRAAGRLDLSYMGLLKDYTARGAQSQGTVVSSTDQFTDVRENTWTAQYAINPPDRLWVDVNVRASLHETARDRRNDGSTETSTWGVDTSYLEIANTSTFASNPSVVHTLRYGADYTRDDVLTAYAAQDGSQIERGRSQVGAYVSETVRLGGALDVVGSLRYDSVGLQSGTRDDGARGRLAVGALAVAFRLQVRLGGAPDPGRGLLLLSQPDQGQVLVDPLFSGELDRRLRGSRQLDHGVRRPERCPAGCGRPGYRGFRILRRPTGGGGEGSSFRGSSLAVGEAWSAVFSIRS